MIPKETVTLKAMLSRYKYESDKNDFRIAVFRLVDTDNELTSEEAIVKGEMYILPDTVYQLQCEEVEDPRFGKQYNLVSSKRVIPVEEMDLKTFRGFMNTFMPKTKVKAVFDKIEDPRLTFEHNDIDELMTVNGIGEGLANRYLSIYIEQKDSSEAIIKYKEWGFTTDFVNKVIRQKGSPELAIKILSENIYDLMQLNGVGFKKIDNIALAHNIKPNDQRRVRAFISDYFDTLSDNGNSYAILKEFIQYLQENIYECDIEFVLDYLKNSDDYKIFKIKNEYRIAKKYIYEKEKKTAEELMRILLDKSRIQVKNVDSIISKTEEQQGWQYSIEQRKAIETMLKSNLFILQGLAGTGKSSVVNGFVRVLKENSYHYVQCALSGKAAQNLAGITGEQGSTIHRLLGYDQTGFSYNKNNPLMTDVVILDEISMVNLDIFYSLLVAIPKGAKLIMIGDNGQLDSIGIGVMDEMLQSHIIPSTTLKKIHRQAQSSAMITHSVSFRSGKKPSELKYSLNKPKVYGDKKDLGYTFVSSDNEDRILLETMRIYKVLVQKHGIQNTQIITPVISVGAVNCDALNKSCQQFSNPQSPNKMEIEISLSKERSFVVRVGDKVINVKNNSHTKYYHSERGCPIFNGNTGIVERIETDQNNKASSLVINFDGIGVVEVPKKYFNSINLGYAITVHKSQGSTLDCVIVALPYQYMLNTRELVYTAITRASKVAYVVTSPRTIKAAIRKTSKKSHNNNLSMLLIKTAKNILKERRNNRESIKI